MDIELEYLSKSFNKIIIIPMTNGNAKKRRTVPENVVVEPYLIPWGRGAMLFKGIFNIEPIWFIINEIFSKKILFNYRKFRNCMIAGLQVRGMLSSTVMKQLLKKKDSKSIFLFNWGNGPGFMIPFINVRQNKLFVRLHGGDLYEDRSFGYIPFRTQLLKSITRAIFISEDGEKYLHERYNDIEFKSNVARLGIKRSREINNSEMTDCLRIVSCSDLLPVKRVHMIAEALELISIDVEWTHIGGGPGYKSLKEKIWQMPKNVKVNLIGQQDNEKVRKIYNKNLFNVFLNVSNSEGIPISIMEALASGIPVIATDVGGTSEIVDAKVGRLLPREISSEQLAQVLVDFKRLPTEVYLKLKQNALSRFNQKCDAKKLCSDLVDIFAK